MCIGSVAVSYFLSDNSKPNIEILNKPTLACNISYNDLLRYAKADDNNLRSFFIEENDLLEIANNKVITYVAIDQSNNVSKKSIDIEVDDDITTYHIETIKPLNAQINQKFVSKDYFVLKNKCGWEIDDTFVVEGVDFNNIGSYDAKIKAKKHLETDVLETIIEVDDFLSPKIVLVSDQVKNYSERYYSNDYFLELIDYIQDDEDDSDDLIGKVISNWQEVLFPTSSGYVDRAGTYTITYRVTDSQGNTGKTTLRLILEKPEPIVVEPEEAGGEE